jgi:hypothetical protein
LIVTLSSSFSVKWSASVFLSGNLHIIHYNFKTAFLFSLLKDNSVNYIREKQEIGEVISDIFVKSRWIHSIYIFWNSRGQRCQKWSFERQLKYDTLNKSLSYPYLKGMYSLHFSLFTTHLCTSNVTFSIC